MCNWSPAEERRKWLVSIASAQAKTSHKKWYSLTEIALIPQDTKGSNNYCYATCATSRLWCHYTSAVSPDSACLHFFAVPMLLSVFDALHADCSGTLRWYPGQSIQHIDYSSYITQLYQKNSITESWICAIRSVYYVGTNFRHGVEYVVPVAQTYPHSCNTAESTLEALHFWHTSIALKLQWAYLEGLDDTLLLIAVPLDGDSGSGSWSAHQHQAQMQHNV